MQVVLILTPAELKLLKDMLYNETQMHEYGAAVMARRVYEKLERAERGNS